MAKARSKRSGAKPRLLFKETKNEGTAVSFSKGKDSTVDLNLAEDKLNTFKTVFLGDSSVGKTCLAKLFVEGEVVEKTTNTIGFDHHVKKVYTEEGVSVKLQIWDTAGMEQFRNALVTKYYRNADGIVLVYDITRRETFEHLESWIREVEQYCTGGLDRVKMILIGNKVDKVDLQDERKVSMEDVQSLMRRYGVSNWIEMSAMNLSNLGKLERIFVALSQQMVSVRESMEVTKHNSKHSNVITLSDDWELITAPDDPVPLYAYHAQDQQLRTKRNSCRC